MEKGQGNVKLGAAVVGGYLLGRFKKGRQAMRLAAYLNGGQTPPQAAISYGRQGVQGLMQNEQAAEIINQIRGPLMEAIQNVALAQVSSRVGGLSDKLTSKTEELQSGVAKGGKKVVDTTEGTAKEGTGKIKGLLGRGKKDEASDETDQEEPEPEEQEDDQPDIADTPDEQQPEPDDEAEGDVGEPDDEDQGAEGEEDEELDDEDEYDEDEGDEEEEPEPEPRTRRVPPTGKQRTRA